MMVEILTAKYADPDSEYVDISCDDGSSMTRLAKHPAIVALIAGGLEIAAHIPPIENSSISPLEFIDRLTEAESLAVLAAIKQNTQLELWYTRLMASPSVDLASPRLIAGLDALVEAGLLTSARKTEILE